MTDSLETACEELAELSRSRWHFAEMDIIFAREWCEYEPLLALAEAVGDDYTRSICSSVRSGRIADESARRQGYVLGGRRKSHITDKQRQLLAAALLERYGTARAIVAAAWNIGEADVQAMVERLA